MTILEYFADKLARKMECNDCKVMKQCKEAHPATCAGFIVDQMQRELVDRLCVALKPETLEMVKRDLGIRSPSKQYESV